MYQFEFNQQQKVQNRERNEQHIESSKLALEIRL